MASVDFSSGAGAGEGSGAGPRGWRTGAALRRLGSPAILLALVFLLLLVWLIVYPFIQLVLRTVTVADRDRRIARGLEEGSYTLIHWSEAFLGRISTSMMYDPLVNTLVTGATAAVLALAVGGVLAWLVVRTDLPGRGALKVVLTLPYVVPSFSLALAWDTLFKNASLGGRPGMMQALTGIAPPEWLSNGPFPIIITLALHYYPFAFLLATGALVAVNAELEEQATLLGAGKAMILRRITLPLLAPAMAAAFILIFAKTMGTFALPYLLGVPVQFHTIATRIFSSMILGLDALAYILSIVLIVITGVVLFISTRLVSKNQKRFQTIGGKGFRARTIGLGRGRALAGAAVWGFALMAGVFPLVLLLLQSLMAQGGVYSVSNLTLHYWLGTSTPTIANGIPGIIHNDVVLSAAWNTIRLAATASFLAAAIGLLIGYIIVREREHIVVRALEQASFLPFLFPGLALAAMYLTMFAQPQGPIPALYGTFALLVLICVVDRLPYGVRTGSSAVMQIGTDLEEAAQLHGATWWQRFRRIAMPLASPGMVAAFMVCFVGIMRELSLIVLLVTPSTGVLMSLGMRFADEGIQQLSSALIILVTAITLVGEVLIWRLGRNRLAKLQEKSTG